MKGTKILISALESGSTTTEGVRHGDAGGKGGAVAVIVLELVQRNVSVSPSAVLNGLVLILR